jgi:hypothetical protein
LHYIRIVCDEFPVSGIECHEVRLLDDVACSSRLVPMAWCNDCCRYLPCHAMPCHAMPYHTMSVIWMCNWTILQPNRNQPLHRDGCSDREGSCQTTDLVTIGIDHCICQYLDACVGTIDRRHDVGFDCTRLIDDGHDVDVDRHDEAHVVCAYQLLVA